MRETLRFDAVKPEERQFLPRSLSLCFPVSARFGRPQFSRLFRLIFLPSARSLSLALSCSLCLLRTRLCRGQRGGETRHWGGGTGKEGGDERKLEIDTRYHFDCIWLAVGTDLTGRILALIYI